MVKKTTTKDAASVLSSLGHEVRLSLYRILVRSGHNGMSFQSLVDQVQVPPSTLTHHLKMLVASGLVVQERQGRETINKPAFETLESVIQFLNDECCKGFD